jgi:hypothetical protein
MDSHQINRQMESRLVREASYLNRNWRWIFSFCVGFLFACVLSFLLYQTCGCADHSAELERLLDRLNACCNSNGG